MKISVKKAVSLSVLSIALGFSSSAYSKLQVVTSFSILEDMVNNVGGDLVQTHSLLPAGADAHDPQFKPNDLKSLSSKETKLLFINGLELEPWISRLTESTGYKGKIVVTTEGIKPIKFNHDHHDHEGHDHHDHEGYEHHDHEGHDHHDHEGHDHHDHEGHEHHDHEGHDHHDHEGYEHHDHEGHDHHDHEGHEHHDHKGHEHHHHHHGAFDPHAWQSLNNATIYVQNIQKALTQEDPENAAKYEENAKNYLNKINQLKEETEKRFSQIPLEKRKALTNHEAFGYFARDYQIDFESALGVSTESEPSSKEVADLIKEMKEDQTRVIFLENISNNRLLNHITEETGAIIGGVLFSDALQPQGDGSTYLGMFKHNVDMFINAFGQ